MDMDSREWSDGVITMAARQVIKDTSVHTWIVCDGDIDPEWIEALNSVLDDNRLVCSRYTVLLKFFFDKNGLNGLDDFLSFAYNLLATLFYWKKYISRKLSQLHHAHQKYHRNVDFEGV